MADDTNEKDKTPALKETPSKTPAAALRKDKPVSQAVSAPPAKGEERAELCSCAKATASTVAGASFGVIGGIAGIATAAVFDIVLPVALCLWATGLAGGAIGLLCGTSRKKG